MPSKYAVQISCNDDTEAKRLAHQLLDQLVDNPDYINNRIILAHASGFGDVFLSIDNIDEVPEITLFKKESK